VFQRHLLLNILLLLGAVVRVADNTEVVVEQEATVLILGFLLLLELLIQLRLAVVVQAAHTQETTLVLMAQIPCLAQ
jgi:hypothetical protein